MIKRGDGLGVFSENFGCTHQFQLCGIGKTYGDDNYPIPLRGFIPGAVWGIEYGLGKKYNHQGDFLLQGSSFLILCIPGCPGEGRVRNIAVNLHTTLACAGHVYM